MLNESCVPVLLKALEKICAADMLDKTAEDCVLSATRVFQRLLKSNSNQDRVTRASQGGSNSAELRLKELGGIDTYLIVMETFKDNEKVTRVVSKLISKMMGGNIGELMATLQSTSLSEAAQERVLSLISSMAMDSSSMDEIMKSGGVNAMIGAMESKMSRRALEETALTVARLASSPKNIPQLIESGALDQICKILANPDNLETNPDMVTSLVVALNRICAFAPTAVETVVAAGVVPCLLQAVSMHEENQALARSVLELLGRLSPANFGKIDLTAVVAAAVPALKLALESDDSETALAVIASLSSMTDAVKGAPDLMRPLLIDAGCVELALLALETTGQDDEGAEGVGGVPATQNSSSKLASELSVASLNLLSNIASSDAGLAKLMEHDAFSVVVEAVGNGIDDLRLRTAAVELIQKISTDAIISEFCSVLVDYAARFQNGQIDESNSEETSSIPKLALALATLAMVPGNISKLQAAGGVAPMVLLLGAIAEMRSCTSQEELMATFASCLTEIVSASSEETLLSGKLFDTTSLVAHCVAVLKNHSKKTTACNAVLKLLRTGISKAPGVFVQPFQEHGGIDAIATQVRLHPADQPELLSNCLHVYTEIVAFEARGVADASNGGAISGGTTAAASKAMEIIQRSGRQLMLSMEQIAATEDPVARAALLPALELLETSAFSNEGRSITSKLGAVKCVLAVLEAQSSQPEIVSQCSRTLQAIVTSADVTKVVSRLQAKLEEPSTGLRAAPNNEAVITAVSDDVKKLGLLMMCGDFSDVIQKSGGVQTVVDIVTVAEEAAAAVVGEEDPSATARDALVRNCITAFGRAAQGGNMELKNAYGIVKEVVRAMTEDPTAEVFKAVAALSKSDRSLCDALVDAGAIEKLIPLLEQIEDSETLNASFEALEAFCSTSDGVDRIVKAGGLEFVMEHLKEKIDGASTEQIAQAVTLLQSITANGSASTTSGIASTLVEAGVLDLINDSLAGLMDSGTPDVNTLTGLQDLVSSMVKSVQGRASDESKLVLEGIVNSGVIQLVDALMCSHPPYMTNVEGVMATNQMLVSLCNEGYAKELHSINASSLLIKAMNSNANDVELARCCAQTVGVIDNSVGGGGNAGTLGTIADQAEAAVKETIAAVAQVAAAGNGNSGEDAMLEASRALAKNLDGLTSNLQLLSNLVLLDTSIDQSSASRLAKLTETTLQALASVPASHDRAKDEATGAALRLLGRLANLSHVNIDTDAATAATESFVLDEYCSEELLASAISCIAGIASSSKGVESIARRGMVARVQKRVQARTVGQRDNSSSDAASVASTCMETITNQAISNAALLVKTQGGAEAIAAILAGIDNPRILASTVDQIARAEGGLQILLDVLCEMGPPDFGGHRQAVEAIIMALLHARDDGNHLKITTPAQLTAIVGAFKLAPSAQLSTTMSAKDLDESGAAAFTIASALVLIETAVDSIEGCQVLAHTPGVLEALVQGISALNVAVSNSCVGSIAKLASRNDASINKRLVAASVTPAMIVALRRAEDPEDKFMANKQFHENAMFTVSSLVHVSGPDACGLQRDALRVVYELSSTIGEESEYCQSLCTSVLQTLTDAFSGGTASLLEEQLVSIGNLPADRLAWQAVPNEDGSTYYYNKGTSATQWDQPEGHAMLLADLSAVGDLVEQLGVEQLKEIDPASFTNLVTLVTSHARDKAAMNKVCSLLAAACKSSKATATLLADMEQTGDIVAAMQYNLGDEEFILNATQILTQLSEFNQFKIALSNIEYITVLNETCRQHVKNAELVGRCCSTLGNLAWGHAENARSCVSVGCHETIRMCMTTHPSSESIANAALFLLEHILEGLSEDDEAEEDEEEVDAQKLEICRQVKDPLIAALRYFSSDEEFFVKAIRCMGNLSLSDDCIVLMVESSATKLTVFGMKEHCERPEHVASAIELLSNFGAIEDDELDEQMTAYLIEEGGLDAILDAMRHYDTSVPILLIGFEALYNIGNDGEAAEKLVELGVVQQSFTVLQNFDYEKKLVAQVMKFMSVFTYNEMAVDVIGEENLMPIVFQAMRTRIENEEFMLDALMAVSNVVQEDRCQKAVEEGGYLPQLLELLTLYDSSVEVTSQVILSCIRLSTNEDISVSVATEGMPFFMRATAKLGMQDTELLSLLIELLFHLAFIKDNIKIIVQHGGIKTLLLIMEVEEYQEDADLMMKVR